MKRANVIVATDALWDWERCLAVAEHSDILQVVSHAPGLMELYTQVETNPPNLVLIASKLCRVPEFDLIVALFKALDVRWVMFDGREAISAAGGAPAIRGSGLFSISLDMDPRRIATHVQSVVHTSQRPGTGMPPPRAQGSGKRFRRMILVGASTGGIDVLRLMLGAFDADCPPTVIVQHIAHGFGDRLTTTLSRNCRARVVNFEPNIELEPGMVCLVAGLSHHAVFGPGHRAILQPSYDPPMSGHCPSIDKLFLSALPHAKRVVAAVLTGMGRDGAEGLLRLRSAGATTLAQDESSSVVYGMPAAAWANGGAMQRVGANVVGAALLDEAAR